MCEIFGKRAVIVQSVGEHGPIYLDRDENGDEFRNKKRAKEFIRRTFPEGTRVSVFSLPVVEPIHK